VTEQAIPLVPVLADVLMLGHLVAARNAARVTLGRLHVGSPAIAVSLLYVLSRGSLPRPAPCLSAVRRHRSSNSVEARVQVRLPRDH
jgi:hypothetical protein